MENSSLVLLAENSSLVVLIEISSSIEKLLLVSDRIHINIIGEM